MDQKEFMKRLKEHQLWLSADGGQQLKVNDVTLDNLKIPFGYSLKDCHIDNSVIRNSHIYSTNIAYAEFVNCSFQRCIFSNCEIDNTRMKSCDFRVSFENCSFKNTKTPDSSFNYSVFVDCDCTKACFDGTEFLLSKLLNCNLTKASIFGADFSGAEIDKATILNNLTSLYNCKGDGKRILSAVAGCTITLTATQIDINGHLEPIDKWFCMTEEQFNNLGLDLSWGLIFPLLKILHIQISE